MALRKIMTGLALLAIVLAIEVCEERYPIYQVPDNYMQVDLEGSACGLGYDVDSFCGDDVVSKLTLEMTKNDFSTSCVHLTNGPSEEFGKLSQIKEGDNVKGLMMEFDMPAGQAALPADCQNPSFSLIYICDKKVPFEQNFNFFDTDGNVLCNSNIKTVSEYNCYGSIQKFRKQTASPYFPEQCQLKVPINENASLFYNICEAPTESICGAEHDPNTTGLQYIDSEGAVQCMSINFPSNLGFTSFNNNGYSIQYEVPPTDALGCEAPTFTEEYVCDFTAVESKIKSAEFFGDDGDLLCDFKLTIAQQSACYKALEGAYVTQPREWVRKNILKDAFAKFEVKLRASATDKMNEYWAYLKDNKWFYFIVMAVLGIFYLLFGLSLFKITLFLFGMLTVSAVFAMLAWGLIISDGTKQWVGWLVFGLGVLLGVFAGWLLLKCVKLGIFLLGAWPGAVCGLLLYNLFLHYIAGNVLLWITVAVLFIVGGLIALWLEDHAIIIATALLGSYLLVRGSSLVIGGYPNEFTVYEEIQAGSTSSFSWQFIVYLVVMALLAVLSIIWQERRLRNEDDDSKESRRKYIKMRKDSD